MGLPENSLFCLLASKVDILNRREKYRCERHDPRRPRLQNPPTVSPSTSEADVDKSDEERQVIHVVGQVM
jgi:hypothetical protein